jgi:hypothetical protein
VAQFVDRALELSRASLLHDLRGILQQIDVEDLATAGACHAPPSASKAMKGLANSP